MKEEKNSKNPDKKTINNIIENYRNNEKTLVKQLYFQLDHGPTIGGFREDVWREMFKQIIPQKFATEQSVFIIDSAGNVSNEVDLAIFDETYTPYIFHYGRLKFIPVEAVAVVVECKSSSLKKKELEKWAESIRALTTSRKSYLRIATGIICGEEVQKVPPTQTQTRPLRILCCLKEQFENQSENQSYENMFDIIVWASSEENRLNINFDTRKKNLKDWFCAMNHADDWQKEQIKDKEGGNINDGSKLEKIELKEYQVKGKDGDISLLSFNLQLNQLLMLFNNPMPFPHRAYSEMFNKFAKGEGADE
ncbi:MAG: DUF6602 domain-containing protein [Candidatus Gastranaerophilaceae bacterium]|nr:DUF6602 domain-containing protein [Christensenellales bacterium]